MRRPFYLDYLDPTDQRTVKRLYVRVAILYFSLALLLFGIATIKLKFFEPHIAAIRTAGNVGMLQAHKLFGLSNAIASERNGLAECASRDLQFITAIEAHGEAQDISAEMLSAAFFSIMKARAACFAGRADEGLAIYDSIVIAPVQSKR